jgi:hypothetical protein
MDQDIPLLFLTQLETFLRTNHKEEQALLQAPPGGINYAGQVSLTDAAMYGRATTTGAARDGVSLATGSSTGVSDQNCGKCERPTHVEEQCVAEERAFGIMGKSAEFCGSCGRTGHGKKLCTQFHCTKCGRTGHTSRVCRSAGTGRTTGPGSARQTAGPGAGRKRKVPGLPLGANSGANSERGRCFSWDRSGTCAYAGRDADLCTPGQEVKERGAPLV